LSREWKNPINIIRRYEEELTKAEIEERITLAHILYKAIDASNLAILSGEDFMIDNAISSLFSNIPVAYWDDDFFRDIEDAITIEYVAQRETWCGVPFGNPTVTQIVRKDAYLIKQAIMSLLERLGTFGKKTRKEIQTGIRYDEVRKHLEDMEQTTRQKQTD